MLSANKPLLRLVATDLMSESPVVLPEDLSLKGAARLLAREGVTGAPVVNSEGKCVGVLSTTDFMEHMNRARAGAGEGTPDSGYYAPWQMVDPEELPDEMVCNCMTRDPVMVTANATLAELAHKLIDAHIHRVVVVDRDNKPIGVVSTMDIVAAVARAEQARSMPINGGPNIDRTAREVFIGQSP
jgi:CBS domain-containing protein